ncbi:MAG: cytochrome c maturation protein CcmE [Saprospiraceae bacterium]|nr:cytochrome c maturation protein CcmE [Saprospiraceae bacterium]
MKKVYIVAGILLLAGIGLLVNASRDMSTYSTFKEAANTEISVKIVGQLSKDKEIFYNPVEDPNYFSFYMRDADGMENKVVMLAKKPQDFELSEQIVLTGQMKGEEFLASDMLMKCPSKYKDEEIYIKSEQSASL